jgi:hypothetical protein
MVSTTTTKEAVFCGVDGNTFFQHELHVFLFFFLFFLFGFFPVCMYVLMSFRLPTKKQKKRCSVQVGKRITCTNSLEANEAAADGGKKSAAKRQSVLSTTQVCVFKTKPTHKTYILRQCHA